MGLLDELARKRAEQQGGRQATQQNWQEAGSGARSGSLLRELSARRGEPLAIEPVRQAVPASQDDWTQKVNEEMGGLERFFVGAGRGMMNVARGIGLAEPEDEVVRKNFERLAEESTAASVGEVVGEAAPFLPLGGIAGGAVKTLGGRVLTGALTGAAQGGITTRGRGLDEGEIVAGTGVGGLVGGAAEAISPVLGRAGGALYRGLTRRGAAPEAVESVQRKVAEQVADEGELLPGDIPADVAQAVRELGDVDPKQAARLAAFQALDPRLVPTKAELTRDATLFQQQQELAKTSGRVRSALENADAILTSRFNQQIERTLGDAQSRASSVAEAVLEKATALDREIGTLYKTAREQAGGEKIVKPVGLGYRLRQVAPSDTRTGGAVSSIVGELKRRGIMDKDMNVIGRVSVDAMEEVRKHINSLHDPQNPFANGVLRNIKDALDDDVMKQSGDDLFKQARAAKAAFERELDTAKVSKFDTRGRHIVRDLLENKINPDRIVEDVVYSRTWRADDLDQLKRYIASTETGQKAISDLRASTLETIKQRAMIGPEDANGYRRMSFDKYRRELDKIGNSKLKVIFDEDELAFLRKMGTVLKMKTPVAGTALGQGPSAQAINALRRQFGGLQLANDFLDSLRQSRENRIMAAAIPERIRREAPRLLPDATRIGGAFGIGAMTPEEREGAR